MLNLLKKKQVKIQYLKPTNITNNSINNSKVIISSPSWKEWDNSIYSYNKDYIKLLVYKDKLVNYLLKSYFNLNKKLSDIKKRRFNPNRFSSNRFFLSKAEIKHTNTNVIITLFILNKNKNFIKYKLNKLRKSLFKIRKFRWDTVRNKFVKIFIFNVKTFKTYLYRNIVIYSKYIKNNIKKRMNIYLNLSKNSDISININKQILELIKLKAIEEEKLENHMKNEWFFNLKKRKKLIKKYVNKLVQNNSLSNYFNQALSLEKLNTKHTNNLKNKYLKTITLLKRRNFKIYKFLYYYQTLVFNKNKFTNWFLNYRSFGIIDIISKIYNKRVEFNIVTLKSMHLNSDIYSEAISLKLRNRKNKLLRVLKKALFNVKIPRLFDLYNINKNNVSTISTKKNVLNLIKYKIISGVRFEASGRLTRRLIASRAVFKFRYLGNLKNIYSSFVGLPTVMLRGYLKPNLQYTIINSKTRNGAFGLKGWVSSY